MLASATWSTAGAKPPRPRPTSAKPSSRKVLSARPEVTAYSRNNDLDEEEVVEDDDGEDDDDEFGAAVEREHQLQQLQRQPQRRKWSGKPGAGAKIRLKPKFRPSSAPAGRPKSALSSRNLQEDKQKRSAASISIAYLRVAAEKKKARDREFAKELFREENEFRKKISVKIEQANKMMTANGSSKSFGPAPVRCSTNRRFLRNVLHQFTHVIMIGPRRHSHDQGSRPRERRSCHLRRDFSYPLHEHFPAYIALVFSHRGSLNCILLSALREFEQLATVPLGQTMQLHTSPSSSNNASSKQTTATSSRTRSSLQRSSIPPRATRLGTRPSSASREPQTDFDGTRSRIKIKPADRSQVQEELRSVLEGTIELTKVLQEQLHELKLKGWNVAPRS